MTVAIPADDAISGGNGQFFGGFGEARAARPGSDRRRTRRSRDELAQAGTCA
jgi:hypothetical protein